MKILLIIFLTFFSKNVFSEITTIYLDSTYLNKSIKINANYYTNSHSNNTAAISIHGTRGFKTMEIVSVLSENLLDLNIDTIAPNISYGVNNRNDSFLTCDMNHNHNRHANINEIVRWFSYAIEKDYKNIILIGHSRGGQDVLNAYKKILEVYPAESKKISSIVLLAPLTDNFDEINDHLQKRNNTTMTQLLDMDGDSLIEMNFLNCSNAMVKISSFLSYYNISRQDETIQILKDIKISTNVFTASEDTFVPKTHSKIAKINNSNINLVQVEDSDHFFRDLFLDEVIEILSEFIE